MKKRTNKKTKLNISLIVIAVFALISIIVGVIAFAVEDRTKTTAFFDTDSTKLYGIDVSEHNKTIDWQKVKNAGAQFAFVRVGYRGWGTGKIILDGQAIKNLKNANKAGIPVGVYFYSQAINEEEAQEEANFVLNEIKGYNVELPIVIDFEYAYDEGEKAGRLVDAKLNNSQRTNLVNAFCKTVEDAGYSSGIYSSTYIFELEFDRNSLHKNALIWVADYNKNNSYTGEYDIWQYEKSGSIDGINSKHVDSNYWYLK